MRRDLSCSSGGKTEDSLGWFAWDSRGTTPRPIVRGTAAGAPPPPPPPHLTSPYPTPAHHPTAPHRTAPHRTPPHCPTPHPTHHLVTWHQSKNPHDGSCGTDCPHALPTLKSVVIRCGSQCIFLVSGRVHPARPPSRTPPWARNAVLWGTHAPTWPPLDRRMPTWRRLSGKVPPWCRQRIRASLWRDLKSGAPPWR